MSDTSTRRWRVASLLQARNHCSTTKNALLTRLALFDPRRPTHNSHVNHRHPQTILCASCRNWCSCCSTVHQAVRSDVSQDGRQNSRQPLPPKSTSLSSRQHEAHVLYSRGSASTALSRTNHAVVTTGLLNLATLHACRTELEPRHGDKNNTFKAAGVVHTHMKARRHNHGCPTSAVRLAVRYKHPTTGQSTNKAACTALAFGSTLQGNKATKGKPTTKSTW
jgi:hypothetical protein